jgi:hypothetical protein
VVLILAAPLIVSCALAAFRYEAGSGLVSGLFVDSVALAAAMMVFAAMLARTTARVAVLLLVCAKVVLSAMM